MGFPLPPNEAQRLAELRRYAVLDTPPEKAFDNITALAARIFKVPIAAVTLIDEDRQWFKSCIGLETREVGRNFAFCAYAILGEDVMVVPDTLEDARFANNPQVTDPPHIRFYAGAPLRTSDGLNLGTLIIGDTKPRKLTKNNIATLADLAVLVVDEIQVRYGIGAPRRAGDNLRLLQAAVHQSSESVMITTADIDVPGPEILFVNPAFTKNTGYTAEEVIGRTPRIFQGPKTDRAILDRLRERLASGEECYFELVNYRKDGSDFVVAAHVSPIRDESGKVTHFIGFHRDATEHHREEAALQEAKEEAERANCAKSEFLSRMSHELRTPLHAILGFAQLLEMDATAPGEKESVAQIVRAGNHLLELINEVLDVARVESGKLALTPEPVNAGEVMEEVLSLVKPLAVERQVVLEPLAGDPRCEVLSNPRRLKQVLLNLLSNAVKFNSEGGKVSVLTEEVEDFLRIKVVDTGPGISAGDLKRLFVPFERLDAGESAIEGAGLGLSHSKHLVEAMGGRIGVESAPGEGTTFWVELPLNQGKPASVEQALDEPDQGGELKQGPAVARTLLYIEDNLSNLRLVERILARRPEIKLISALKGVLGLELARQHQPDLVLLDLQLPDIQGDEVLRSLRADPRTAQIPVVMVSADATTAQIERLRAAGAQDYLTKPIDVRNFLAVIDAIEPLKKSPPL